MSRYKENIIEKLDRISQGIDYQNRLLKTYLDERLKVNESYFLSELVIAANSDYETIPINNDRFEFMRIYCSVVFDPAATAGISIYLYDSGTETGELLKIKSSRNAVGGMSEPFDITAWGGFYFIIKNHDVYCPVNIKQLRIIQYNSR